MDTAAPEPTERADEVTRLRERLSFYESFDRLIQDNIAKSGDLLRQAMDVKETASAEIAAAQVEVARKRAGDQSRYRLLFSVMLDELTELQGQAERLARRLTDALDEIENELPAGSDAAAMAEIAATDDGGEAATLALDSGEAEEAIPPAIESLTAFDVPIDIQPFSPDDVGPRDVATEGIEPEPQYADVVVPIKGRGTIILVHGVPRATTALSLKRYLEGLDHVATVEPREFAEGILRLEIDGVRPVALDDLRSWPEGARLEAVHVRDDLLEVRLAP